MKRPGTTRTTPSSTPPSSTPRATAPGRGGCRRATRNKARRAFSHAGRMLSAGSRVPAGRWFWSLSTGASWAQGRRTGQPAQIRAPSGCASLSGGCTPRPGLPAPNRIPHTPSLNARHAAPPPATGSPGQNPAAAPQGFLPLRRAGVRRRRATARSTLTNPPTCPTATTNPVPSTLKASNVRCAVVWGGLSR